jgi:hypothetical protein
MFTTLLLALTALHSWPALAYSWEDDLDGDGWYSMASGGADCDDYNSANHPGAYESCDGADNDCNGLVDETTTAERYVYPDRDGDGFGLWSGWAVKTGCDVPEGYSGDGSDCDDTNPEAYPGATEICGDGVDQACNSHYDEGATYTFDHDGDGYGGWDGMYYCDTTPTDTVEDTSDCDDADAAINPGAEEVCANGSDDNCDGYTYDGEWYITDADADGWAGWVQLCDTPASQEGWSADCDETNPAINPDAIEVCGNDVDEDCDWSADQGPGWVVDNDQDGWGDWGTYLQACDQPDGMVSADYAGDCDDGSPDIRPDQEELCQNDVDDNCDGWAWEGDPYAFDDDADGWGAWDGAYYCYVPDDAVGDWSDCDDADEGVNPGEEEICQNGVDEDCDGYDWSYVGWYYTDADGDRFGTGWGEWLETCDLAGYADNPDDCNDADGREPLIHDCHEPFAGNLVNTGTQAVWANATWSGGFGRCGGYSGAIRATEARSHTVSTPREGGAPGAPVTSAWVNGEVWGIDWCTYTILYSQLSGSDIQIVGAGARTRLTGTVTVGDGSGSFWGLDVVGIGWGNGEVPIDLTWVSTGPASWRSGEDTVQTGDGYIWRYDWSGTGRDGTASGTIGTYSMTGATGSTSSRHDGVFNIWSE